MHKYVDAFSTNNIYYQFSYFKEHLILWINLTTKFMYILKNINQTNYMYTDYCNKKIIK